LALKQKVEILKDWEGVKVGFCKSFFSCNLQIHVTSTPHSQNVPNTGEFTVVKENSKKD
jgi:hypothetical protein